MGAKQLAFYAPLKSPEHPVPSGDREIAQGIMAALTMNSLDLKVTLASQLRSYDGLGDKKTQQNIRAQAVAEVERVVDLAHDWQAWVTYHNYYKAPDLIGVEVSRRLKIPYILIEASIAKGRLSGSWSDFAVSADNATASADVVFYLTEKDRVALEKYRPEKQKLVYLPPFLKQTVLPVLHQPSTVNNHLLTVAMHRYGDKLESYRILADALGHLSLPDWRLSIIGDGPARADIELMFADYGEQVVFLGQLDRTAVAAAYCEASVFVWPGVNEAFGLVYLEAQAAGLPVVAQDRAGVREVIASPESLVPVDDPKFIAAAIERVLGNPTQYETIRKTGREMVEQQHLLDTAARRLSAQLSLLIR